jgi:DNA-directed RNA polymerase specialized sigma24 family protein
LFDFERINSGKTAKVTVTRRQSQRAEDRRRDIYDSHRHRTFGIAYYMTGNEVEAEKILTNTFVKAFSAMEEPGGPDVDAALVSELGARFPLGAQAAPVTQEYAAAGGPDLSQRNIRRTDLEEALTTLPAAERLLFLLHDVEGYKPAAIAPLLQIPEAQVIRSLISARILMRRALTEVRGLRERAA